MSKIKFSDRFVFVLGLVVGIWAYMVEDYGWAAFFLIASIVGLVIDVYHKNPD